MAFIEVTTTYNSQKQLVNVACIKRVYVHNNITLVVIPDYGMDNEIQVQETYAQIQALISSA